MTAPFVRRALAVVPRVTRARTLAVVSLVTALIVAGACPTEAPPSEAANGAAPTSTTSTTSSAAPAKAWVEPSVPRCSYADVLTKYDYDALKGGKYCEVCKDVDDTACELDWPSSDVPTCGLLDEMRNEIFAYYGRPFEKERWKTRFAAKTWYAASADYTDARLSPVARANVAKLQAARARHAASMKDTGDASCAD